MYAFRSSDLDGFSGGKYLVINGKEYCFDAYVESNSAKSEGIKCNESMTIASNITMINGVFVASPGRGSLTNHGTIIGGTITLVEAFSANCIEKHDGEVVASDDESRITNTGTIYNLAEMKNSGHFTNAGGGTVYNTGTITTSDTKQDHHIAEFNNNGKIINIGTFIVGDEDTKSFGPGSFSNLGTIKIAIKNSDLHGWDNLSGTGNYGIFGEKPAVTGDFNLSNMKPTKINPKIFKIFSGDTLTVPPNKKLIIPTGYTLINAGTIKNLGSVVNDGILKHDMSTGRYSNHEGDVYEKNAGTSPDIGVISGSGTVAIFGSSLLPTALPGIYPITTFEVRPGDTLSISSGKALIIPSGVTLKNYGIIMNSGTIIDQGKLANLKLVGSSSIINSGSIFDYGTLQNNFTSNIGTGGTNGTITNTGKIFQCTGGTYFGFPKLVKPITNSC
jgi:hypothetical protein